MSYLTLQNISLGPSESFPAEILSDLTLDIAKGDFIILLGGNGSGKSSLLKVLNGLYSPCRGSYFLQQQNLLGYDIETIGKFISTLTQDLTLSTYCDLTIAENIKLALMGHELRHPLLTYLDSFNPVLHQKLKERVRNLSGGERQSLALALCFLRSPSLLLLDEHTSALDPKTATRIMEITASHIEKENITTIMTTHRLEDALKYGNRIIMLQKGRIALDLRGKEKDKLSIQDLLLYY